MARIAKTKTGIGRKGTTITERDGLFEVKLYDTYVYSEMDGTVTLQNGGWNTPTTAQRINSALQYRGFKSGILTAGGTMTYEGKPFVNGALVLTIKELKKIKEDFEVKLNQCDGIGHNYNPITLDGKCVECGGTEPQEVA